MRVNIDQAEMLLPKDAFGQQLNSIAPTMHEESGQAPMVTIGHDNPRDAVPTQRV